MSSSRKRGPWRRRTTSSLKTVYKPRLEESALQKMVYDPADFLEEMDEKSRQKFENLYPKTLYDDAARHRIIVSGELARHDFWCFNNPRQGTFFLDEQGVRMVYGRDIQAYKDKRTHTGTLFDKDGREHLLFDRGNTAANRSIQYSYVGRHSSETQWNVPTDNEHHFLNFPAEIRTQILEHLLTVTVPIIPKTIVCTWRTNIEAPGYSLEGCVKQLKESIVKIPRQDELGTYTEIRRIYRKPIDATCIRVNKQFLSEGSVILYGRNTFNCSYVPYYLQEKGRLRTLGDGGRPILKNATKPTIRDIDKYPFMQSVCGLMKGRDIDDNLEGWIYCDPLLRFLRTIGPINAANLRSLWLGGYALKYNLRLYGPFIERYCLGIRKLTIGPVRLEDSQLTRREMERALFQVLRSGLMSFPSLKTLVVLDDGKQPVAGADELMRESRIQRRQMRYRTSQKGTSPQTSANLVSLGCQLYNY